jgi:thiopeptide-type bacteriocin biosynthesis protein
MRVYAAPGRHGELLTRHLPELARQAAPVTDRWFFLRYRDDEPHLRVRFHGEPPALNTHLLPAAHHWADDLATAGVISGIVLDTYRPEIDRYGGPELIEAAEHVFSADTRSVLEQLALRGRGLLDLRSTRTGWRTPQAPTGRTGSRSIPIRTNGGCATCGATDRPAWPGPSTWPGP